MKIQGWIKNFETKNKAIWTQNKYNPLRLTVEKNRNSWLVIVEHRSHKPKILKRTLKKQLAKNYAYKVMRGMKVSFMSQRVKRKK